MGIGASASIRTPEQSRQLGTVRSQMSPPTRQSLSESAVGPAPGRWRDAPTPSPRAARAPPPLQTRRAERASHTNHTKTKTAERPFLERPAFSEVDAVRSRLSLAGRLDASPSTATGVPQHLARPVLCAQARKGASPPLPLTPGVPPVLGAGSA